MDEGRDIIQIRRPLNQRPRHFLLNKGNHHKKNDEEEVENDYGGLNEVVNSMLAKQLGDDAKTQSKEKDELDDECDVGAQTRAGT
jgi:hypothetical protein